MQDVDKYVVVGSRFNILQRMSNCKYFFETTKVIPNWECHNGYYSGNLYGFGILGCMKAYILSDLRLAQINTYLRRYLADTNPVDQPVDNVFVTHLENAVDVDQTQRETNKKDITINGQFASGKNNAIFQHLKYF